MNKEIKKRWLEALRSGEYKQCRGQLRHQDELGQESFCCLGLLTNLYIQQTGEGEWLGMEHFRLKGTARGMGGYLPLEVAEWAEIPEENQGEGMSTIPIRVHRSVNNMYHLASMNDGEMSFFEIANVIEDQL